MNKLNQDIIKIIFENYLDIFESINFYKTSLQNYNLLDIKNIEYLSDLYNIIQKNNSNSNFNSNSNLTILNNIIKYKNISLISPKLKNILILLKNNYVDNYFFENIKKLINENNKYIVLVSKYYGMGHYNSLSFINNYNNEKKFFYSMLGGSNGWDQDDNSKLYKNKKISELNLMNVETAFNLFYKN